MTKVYIFLEKQTLRPDFTGDSSKIKTKANQTNS